MNESPTTLQAVPFEPGKPAPRGVGWRLAIFACLFVLAIGARYIIFKTPFGAKLQDRPFVLDWVAHHRVTAPLALVGVYCLCSVLMLPVWPLQVAGGYCFGLVYGILWCDLGAAIGGTAALLLSRLLVGQWFHDRYESRVAKLHALSEKLGDNGLYVVLGVRLCHILPFGVSNYLFGLTRITPANVFLGTLGGGTPAIGGYVLVGAGLAKHWRPWAVLVAINVILLMPLAVRIVRSRRLSKAKTSTPPPSAAKV